MAEILPRSDSSISLTKDDFSKLSEFIYKECGIKMPPAKKTMLEARLQKRLRTLGMPSFSKYCDFLFSSDGLQQELVQMIDLVTTNKTDFFREPDHFDYLAHKVLPQWMDERGGTGRRLNVWSAGCSTGEEPYTLAMVLQEFADENPGFNYHIMATDISTRVLEKARTAIYDEERVIPVPMPLKRKYLLRSKDRTSGLVRIAPELRGKVNFHRLNFMDSDFGLRERLDIIFCRNVIIYFDRPPKKSCLTSSSTTWRRGPAYSWGTRKL